MVVMVAVTMVVHEVTGMGWVVAVLTMDVDVVMVMVMVMVMTVFRVFVRV